MIPLVPSLLLLLFLFPAAVARNAYVSLLYGDSYVLPARVLMHSLLQSTPDLDADRVIIAADVSPPAVAQLRADGLLVHPVPPLSTPYQNHTKYRARFNHVVTKLYIFNLTQYSAVLFLDADSLVLRPLTSVFSCGRFCATFINPCNFNAGLLKITPNATLFQTLLHALSSTPSYDAGDQGFLNAFFPNMLRAPMFDPQNPLYPPPEFARLPFQYHADHSVYFPTGAFEFPKSPRCGPPKSMEWLGPVAAKPWLWWTFPVFDLSWTWNRIRRQLKGKYPPGSTARRDGIALMLFSWALVVIVIKLIKKEEYARLLTSVGPFISVTNRFSMVVPVMLGIGAWAVLLAWCVWVMPLILMPYEAMVVIFHIRVSNTFAVLALGGYVLCAGQAGKLKLERGGKDRMVGECLQWAVADGAFLVLADVAMWQLRVRDMWSRGMFVIGMVVLQFLLALVMVPSVYGKWTRVRKGQVMEDVKVIHVNKWQRVSMDGESDAVEASTERMQDRI